MLIVEVSTLILVGVAVAWVVTQVFTLWAAKWVVQRAQKESQTQKDEVVAHFDKELHTLETRLESGNGTAEVETKIEDFRVQLEDFRQDFAGFASQLGEDLSSLPRTLAMHMLTEKGMETRAVQHYLDEAGEDIEQAGSVMEAYAAQDPELMMATAMKKVAEWKPSKKYAQEHPLIVAALEMGKPMLLNQLQGMMLGTSTKRSASGTRGTLPSPYGR